MVEDTWAEKPSILINSGTLEVGVNPEFGAWLVKMKAEYDAMDELNAFMWNKIDELEDKLETIKTSRNYLYEALPIRDVFDLLKVIRKHIEELDKILEVDV